MDANSQLPGRVDHHEQTLEEIGLGLGLAALEQDLDEHEEAHGTGTGEEELEFFMPLPPPPRYDGGAARYLSILILEEFPGRVDHHEQTLEEISLSLAALERDLDEYEEAHGTGTGDGEEELEYFMPLPPPPRYDGGAARYWTIPILEEELRRIGAEMDRNIALFRSMLEPEANGCVPASAAFVASLEVHKYGGACAVPDVGATGTCVICTEDFEVGDDLSVLPCRHGFHRSCVAEWLARSRFCPLCRHALPAEGTTTSDTAQAPNY